MVYMTDLTSLFARKVLAAWSPNSPRSGAATALPVKIAAVKAAMSGGLVGALADGAERIAECDLGHIGEEPERQYREEGQPNLAGGQGVETRADREARLRGRALSGRDYQAGRTPSNWAGGAGMARRPASTPDPAVAASKAAAMITSLVAWTRA